MIYLAEKPFDLPRAVSFVERPRPVAGELHFVFRKISLFGN
jgi:hypothetical protein